MADTVAELNPADDLGQAVAAIEFTPFCLGGHHEPERHGEAGLAAQAALGALRSMSDGGECALDRVGRANVFPMFRGVVVEAQECVPVFDQFGDRLVPFHAVGLDEKIEGDIGVGLRVGLPASRDIAAQCPAGQWMSCRCAFALA